MYVEFRARSPHYFFNVFSALLIFVATMLFFPALVQAAEPGDVNIDGRIDVQDVALTMRGALGLEILSDRQRFLADVNADELVNVQDVSLLMQKSLGLLEGFAKAPVLKTGLVDQFITADGLSPGAAMVVVTLAVKDQENYRVFVGPNALYYSAAIEGFIGEVPEKEALEEKVTVYLK